MTKYSGSVPFCVYTKSWNQDVFDCDGIELVFVRKSAQRGTIAILIRTSNRTSLENEWNGNARRVAEAG